MPRRKTPILNCAVGLYYDFGLFGVSCGALLASSINLFMTLTILDGFVGLVSLCCCILAGIILHLCDFRYYVAECGCSIGPFHVL